MPAIPTRYYGFLKPEGSDMYDINIFNNNADSIDSYIHFNAEHIQDTQNMFAPVFVVTSSYSVGDKVIKDNGLYKFKVAHAPGNWDASEVEPYKVTESSIITGTLTAGQTSITILSDYITTDSVLAFYTSIYGVNPLTVLASAGSVTLTFNAQATNMDVGVEIVR